MCALCTLECKLKTADTKFKSKCLFSATSRKYLFKFLKIHNLANKVFNNEKAFQENNKDMSDILDQSKVIRIPL